MDEPVIQYYTRCLHCNKEMWWKEYPAMKACFACGGEDIYVHDLRND